MSLGSWCRQVLGFLAAPYWRRTTMFTDPAGPIESFTWARFVIAGQVHGGPPPGTGAGKDIRLVGTEVTAWTDRVGHRLDIAMITGVFDRGLEALILGLGANRAIDCPPEVVAEIRRRGIPQVELADTVAACRRYNELFRQGRKVGLLAHGTC
ncbi:MAG: hypothetical protein GX442_25995 [Candidatus Riflebacteria bacterium]|nr:hypothetical protein [Candidatus Riflebacteria bacterium]